MKFQIQALIALIALTLLASACTTSSEEEGGASLPTTISESSDVQSFQRALHDVEVVDGVLYVLEGEPWENDRNVSILDGGAFEPVETPEGSRFYDISTGAAGELIGCYGVEGEAFLARYGAGGWTSTRVGAFSDPCGSGEFVNACWGGTVVDCEVMEDASGTLHGAFVTVEGEDDGQSRYVALGHEGVEAFERTVSADDHITSLGFGYDGGPSILISDYYGVARHSDSDEGGYLLHQEDGFDEQEGRGLMSWDAGGGVLFWAERERYERAFLYTAPINGDTLGAPELLFEDDGLVNSVHVAVASRPVVAYLHGSGIGGDPETLNVRMGDVNIVVETSSEGTLVNHFSADADGTLHLIYSDYSGNYQYRTFVLE